MKKFFLSFTRGIIVSLLFVQNIFATEELDYRDKTVIVGAGPAGAYIAYLLKDKEPIVILEGSSRIGGKCESFIIEEDVYDHGAIQLPSYYEITHNLVKEFGLETIPSPPLNFTNGQEVISHIKDTYGYPAFLKAYAQYTYYAWLYRDIVNNPVKVDEIDLLKQPLADFLKEKNLIPLRPIFDICLTAYGYGNLEKIPAHHAFYIIPYQQMVSMFLGSMPLLSPSIKPMLLLKNGYQQLIEKIIEFSQAEIKLNMRVHQIRMSDFLDHVILTSEKGTQVLAKKVIITVPFKSIEIDYLNEDKNSLYNQLKESIVYSPYTTTIFSSPEPLPCNFIINEFNNSETFSPTMIGRKYPQENIYISYAYGKEENLKDIKDNLKEFIWNHYNINSLKILSQRAYDTYYPHPSFESLNQGFYSKLNMLQKDGAIYFSGSLLSFEIIERTFQAAQKLIHDHFRN